MSLILRQQKGSKLTISEMDGNLTYLEELAINGGKLEAIVEVNSSQLSSAYTENPIELLQSPPAGKARFIDEVRVDRSGDGDGWTDQVEAVTLSGRFNLLDAGVFHGSEKKSIILNPASSNSYLVGGFTLTNSPLMLDVSLSEPTNAGTINFKLTIKYRIFDIDED